MADELYELSIDGTDANGNFWANVFYYTVDTSMYADEFSAAKDLATSWATGLPGTRYLAVLGSDVVIKTSKARRVKPTGGFTYVYQWGGAGGFSSNTFSAGMACNYKWRAVGPPYKWGHTYIGPLPTDALNEDSFESGWLAALSSWGVVMFSVVLTGSAGLHATFVLYSRKAGTWAPLVSGEPATKATPIRRRLLPQY